MVGAERRKWGKNNNVHYRVEVIKPVLLTQWVLPLSAVVSRDNPIKTT